ncbi:MAG: hypothetical protein ACI90A_000864, partial [Shewanella sp.]
SKVAISSFILFSIQAFEAMSKIFCYPCINTATGDVKFITDFCSVVPF